MDEVERLCDRIVLLKDGVARAYGKVSDVQEQFGGTTVKITHGGALPALPCFRIIADDLAGHSEVALTPGTDPAEVLRQLVAASVPVAAFTPSRRSLDSIFVEIYGAPPETGPAGKEH
jgi:ABC-2 type transport system ATP-binding protein